MALDKTYLESLGLEIAKRKYYNAARVESVIEDFCRRSTTLEEENRALHARLEELSFGREEIGDAILSAKTIAQQLISEAREKSESILREAREEAERTVSEARRKSEEILSGCEGRERQAFEQVRNCYEHLREQHVSSLELLDREWQSFLCSLDEEAQRDEEAAPLPENAGSEPAAEPAEAEAAEPEKQAAAPEGADELPPDLARRVSEIAAQLQSLELE